MPTTDGEIHHYLQIADFEAVNIATVLRYARQEAESRFQNIRARSKAAWLCRLKSRDGSSIRRHPSKGCLRHMP